MSAETDRFVLMLVSECPDLRPLFDEHVAYYDEILSTLFMAEIVEWLVAAREDQGKVGGIFDALDRFFVGGGLTVETVISTGFLEALPYGDEEGTEIVGLLGPALAEELRSITKRQL